MPVISAFGRLGRRITSSRLAGQHSKTLSEREREREREREI
jgi:hypothetical protein